MWFISKRLHRQMLKAKERDIQELSDKVAKQDKLLEELRNENRTLKQAREYDARNNVKILEQSNEKRELINSIAYILGKYDVPTATALIKIKELVHDYQSKN